MMDEWRTVPGYPDYEVHSSGEIRCIVRRNSSPAGHILKGSINLDDYRRVQLFDPSGNRRDLRVNRIVCEAFHGPPPDGALCLHNDGDRSHNAASNLRWGTAAENAADRLLHRSRHEEHLMPKGRGCKAKGDTFERDLAEHFSAALSLNVRRTPLSGAFSMVRGSGSADLTGLPHLWIEAKRVERVNIHQAMAQAKRGCAAHHNADMPVVITRRNRQPLDESLVVLELRDFITLYQSFLSLRMAGGSTPPPFTTLAPNPQQDPPATT